MADAHIGLWKEGTKLRPMRATLLIHAIFGVVDNPMDFLSHFQKAQEFFTDL